MGVWVLAAVGAGLVGQWQGIISLYLLIQMTLNGVHLVPVKLHQEWICPTPTCCANVCSHSTCLLLFLALFWEWQLQEWLFPSQKNWWNRGFEFPTWSCTNTFSLVTIHRENFRGVEELALVGAGNQLIILQYIPSHRLPCGLVWVLRLVVWFLPFYLFFFSFHITKPEMLNFP